MPWLRAIAFLLVLPVSLVSVLAAGPDAEAWSAKLVDLSASYGQETWKYDLGYEGQASPAVVVGHLQNRTASYYGALGLRVSLRIEIFDTADRARNPSSSYNVTAYIPTSRGDLYAYVRRDAPDSRMFQLDFDVDGANNADPRGQVLPALDPGAKEVRVSVTRRVNDPTAPSLNVGQATLRFGYEMPAQTVTISPYASLPHLQLVPDSMFRLYNDIGWDKSVLFVTRPVNRTFPVDLQYQFPTAAAGRTVELYGFIAERAVSTPAGPQPAPAPTLPFIGGISDNESLSSALDQADALVVITKKALGNATLDATGAVRFNLDGTALLNVRSPAPAAALVAVAPVLTDNFDPALCPGDCAGGTEFTVGATELVLPVSDERVVIDGYKLLDSSGVGANVPPQAPPQVREYALGINALQVFVRDVGRWAAPETRTGDLVALVPDGRNAEPLAMTSLSPNPREEIPPGELLAGNLPVLPIQQQKVSHYRVVALTYTNNDVFHGVGFGDRGYVIELATVPGAAGRTDAQAVVTLRSRTTNYDSLPEEPMFDVRVVYQVEVPDLRLNVSKNVTLKELGMLQDVVTVPNAQPGQALVRVPSTSGDTLPRPREAQLEWVEDAPKKSLVERLPGFEGVLAAVAVAGAIALGRRRHD